MDKPAEAIAYLEKAIQLNPDDHYSYYYLGLSLYEKGNYSKAESAFTSAIKDLRSSESYLPNCYELRGNCRVKLGNFDGAVSDYTETSKLSPNDPSPYFEKGKVLLKLKADMDAVRLKKLLSYKFE